MRWARCLAMGVALVTPLGCHAFVPVRVPAPERALASEADSPSSTAALPAVAAGEPVAAHDGRARASGRAEEELTDEPGDATAEPLRGPGRREEKLPVASQYARLGRAACEAELRRRSIAFEPLESIPGVLAPLRLAGPLSGVRFRSNLPPEQSRTSPYDIYDCRLVLALDDFARVLAKYDIIEVVHFSVYRPVRRKKKRRPDEQRPDEPGRRHAGALAIDAARFKTRDGRTLSVLKDFRGGRIGTKTCPPPASASELRRIACEAGEAGLFNVLLTPHYNRAHRDHFHLEVTAGVTWTLIR